MEMSASDGPHYGANVKLPNADTYTLEITIKSPADNNYLLHTDAETGPGAKSFDETEWPLVVTYEGWDYTPQEWESPSELRIVSKGRSFRHDPAQCDRVLRVSKAPTF